jgi:hypothetical protein
MSGSNAFRVARSFEPDAAFDVPGHDLESADITGHPAANCGLTSNGSLRVRQAGSVKNPASRNIETGDHGQEQGNGSHQVFRANEKRAARCGGMLTADWAVATSQIEYVAEAPPTLHGRLQVTSSSSGLPESRLRAAAGTRAS